MGSSLIQLEVSPTAGASLALVAARHRAPSGASAAGFAEQSDDAYSGRNGGAAVHGTADPDGAVSAADSAGGSGGGLGSGANRGPRGAGGERGDRGGAQEGPPVGAWRSRGRLRGALRRAVCGGAGDVDECGMTGMPDQLDTHS